MVFTLPKGGTGEAPESIYLKDITSLQCMTDALLKMRDGIAVCFFIKSLLLRSHQFWVIQEHRLFDFVDDNILDEFMKSVLATLSIICFLYR